MQKRLNLILCAGNISWRFFSPSAVYTAGAANITAGSNLCSGVAELNATQLIPSTEPGPIFVEALYSGDEHHAASNNSAQPPPNYQRTGVVQIPGQGHPFFVAVCMVCHHDAPALRTVTLPAASQVKMPLNVNAGCIVGKWSAVSPCSVPCGAGIANRTRAILKEPQPGDAPCPITAEYFACYQDAPLCIANCTATAAQNANKLSFYNGTALDGLIARYTGDSPQQVDCGTWAMACVTGCPCTPKILWQVYQASCYHDDDVPSL